MIIGCESEEVAEFKIEVAEFKIDGVYSKICKEKIEKLQSISEQYVIENWRFNFKIMTFDSVDLKEYVDVDDYDVLLIKCENENDIQELHILNSRCIFFSSDEALISFASCLYIVSCNYNFHTYNEYDHPLDALSFFVNTKVPLKYANTINSLENVKYLFVMFFEKEGDTIHEIAKKTNEIWESYPNIIDYCFDICLQDFGQDFGTDLMAFYI